MWRLAWCRQYLVITSKDNVVGVSAKYKLVSPVSMELMDQAVNVANGMDALKEGLEALKDEIIQDVRQMEANMDEVGKILGGNSGEK